MFALALPGPASPAAAAAEPGLNTPVATLDAALHCPSSFAHPDREPVLLVHGTSSTSDESWGYAPALRDAGYDVCGVDLTNRSMGDIQESTEYVVHAVERINAITSRKVDVIGHSQGNMQIRWALKWWPSLRGRVEDAVFLANPGHGIGAGNLFCAAPLCSRVAPVQRGIHRARHDRVRERCREHLDAERLPRPCRDPIRLPVRLGRLPAGRRHALVLRRGRPRPAAARQVPGRQPPRRLARRGDRGDRSRRREHERGAPERTKVWSEPSLRAYVLS
ncbi:esterase/lipase family protein [Streptomyces zaomyceticus]|uniref:esterase/lipase family protein n=1 Tax=Streptomyces zaomyceticus TaxID=68286 RepID=UPI0016786ED3|nr:hypothetical protein [Streptomyces zaomyceticus]